MYSKLSNESTITDLVSTRIYALTAPAGASRPYIIFYDADTGVPNLTQRQDFDCIYRVEAVADSRAVAEDIQQAIYALLHNGQLTAAGWNNFALRGQRLSKIVEEVEGDLFWRHIGDYLIRWAKNEV